MPHPRPPISPAPLWLAAPAAALVAGGLVLAVQSTPTPEAVAIVGQSATESTASTDTTAERLQDLSAEATPLASGLQDPTSIAAPDDDSGRLLITERPGTVRAYHPDTGLASSPLLDVSELVESDFLEQGLLGIATAPDFAQDPALYVSYTEAGSDDVVLSRFPMDSPDQDTVDVGGEEVILTQDHSVSPSHNAGQLAFGPDGHLYMSIGDGGFPADPVKAGQDLGTWLGTILRLDVSAECDGQAYCVPDDNPFLDDPEALPEIWAYGLRNPWRFSFDRADGSMWIGDIGESTWEEVNHVSEGGANFGWSCMEGPVLFDEEQCFADRTLTDPVFSYTRDVGCSVTGGYVYRGQQYADVATGVYVATDWCTGNTWGIVPQTGEYAAELIGQFPTLVNSLGEDVDGELYAVNLEGQLLAVSFS